MVTRGIATGTRRGRRPRTISAASGQGHRAHDLDPIDESRLVDRRERDDDPPEPARGDRGDHRQDARHGPDLAVETQLAEKGDRSGTRAYLFRPEQDADRDREIERGAGLAQLGRRKVDRDATRREGEARVADGTADALAGLLHGRVGQPDDREPRQPGRDVHLDADGPTVETVQRGGRDDGQHAAHPIGGRSPRTYPPDTRRSAGADRRSLGRGRDLVHLAGEVEHEAPSGESALVNMNGAPELSALIAPRYSFTIWWSIVRLRAPSAFLTLMPGERVRAVEDELDLAGRVAQVVHRLEDEPHVLEARQVGGHDHEHDLGRLEHARG